MILILWILSNTFNELLSPPAPALWRGSSSVQWRLRFSWPPGLCPRVWTVCVSCVSCAGTCSGWDWSCCWTPARPRLPVRVTWGREWEISPCQPDCPRQTGPGGSQGPSCPLCAALRKVWKYEQWATPAHITNTAVNTDNWQSLCFRAQVHTSLLYPSDWLAGLV